jgi:hypothetical protein
MVESAALDGNGNLGYCDCCADSPMRLAAIFTDLSRITLELD